MNIAVVGFATEGQVSAEYFTRQGHEVTVCDQNDGLDVPTGYKKQLGEGYLDNLDAFDLIVRTAGMHPHLILEKNPSAAPKMTTAVNEFLAHCPTRNVIGITGTKGKGTTSTLTAKMLEAGGRTVWLGGNIGRSPLEFIGEIQPDDWVVLELSSFQLIDVQYSPHIAVCLMIVPEHLNWHADMAEYVDAKSRLFMQQSSDDAAIYYADNETSRAIAGHGAGKKIPFFAEPGAWINGNMLTIDGESICATDEIRLLGVHNQQNVCAALTAAWRAGVCDLDALRSAITSFAGLEHRLEFVREIDGVRYYDDSFGTTPETAIVALQAFKEPKVIILGGSDKGASYEDLARSVQHGNVREALLIGDQAERIREALEKAGFHDYIDGGTTMAEIIAGARAAAKPGDVVLLSTGCASFGLFKDYKDRGNQFKIAVQNL
jgi:UDP-N-acetylmuramoylalanine--D-glutamate ligase